MGVGAILEDFDAVATGGQEAQLDRHVALVPVCHRADIPGVTLAARHRDELADLSVQHQGLIPDRRDLGDVFRALGLLQVVGRGVAEHRERGVENDVFRQLAATGAGTHGLAVDGAVVAKGRIAHRALRVVERTGQHAQEGDGDIVDHLLFAILQPLHLLQAVYALEVDDIGIGAVQARRLVGTMEIDHHLVLGTHLGAGGIEVDHILVVTVHEIDLEALDTHAGEMQEDILHVAVDRPVAGPEDQAHVLFLGVCAELLEVDLGHDLHQVGLLVDRPSFVQDDILDALLGSEIDVVFVGFVVDPSLEINPVDVPVVPPVPGDLAGLDPAPIAGLGRRGEFVHHIAAGQFLVLTGDLDHAPREGAAGHTVLGDEVLAAEDHALEHVVAALLDQFRDGCMEALDGLGAIQVANVEAREIEQVRLGDRDLVAVGGADDQGKEGGPGLIPVLQLEVVVDILERALDLLFDRPVRLAAIGHDGVPVAGEGELRLLGLHVHPLLAAGDETIGNTLVVGAEHQVESLVAQRQLVVTVAHGSLFVDRRIEGLVVALANRLDQLRIAAIDGPVGQGHRDRRGGEHLDTVRRDGIFELVDRDGDASVGRLQSLRLRLGRKSAERTEAEQQGEKHVFFHYAVS